MEEAKKSIGMKIYLALFKFYTKWILKVRSRNRLLLLFYIQHHAFESINGLKISTMNKMVLYIADVLFNEESPEKIVDGLEYRKEELDSLISKLKINSEIKCLIADHYRITAFYYAFGNSELFENEIRENVEKAKEFNPDYLDLDKTSISKLDKSIKKKIKAAKKKGRKISKDIISKDVNKVTPKVEIDSSKVSFVLSLSCSLFLVTGYFYNKFYLGHFDIEVSVFFTLGDYLASSLDKITIAIMSAIVALVFYIAGMYRGLNRVVSAEHYDTEIKHDDWPMFIFVIINSGLLIYAAYTDHFMKEPLFQLMIIIASLGIIHIIPTEKFVKNHVQVNIVLVALLYFSLSIYYSVKGDIRELEKGGNESGYSFSFKNEIVGDKGKLRLLGSNSSYYFFYSIETKKSYIVNRGDVILVEASNG